jgi:hypothetical protein
LAEYASRLGLDASPDKMPGSSANPGCVSAAVKTGDARSRTSGSPVAYNPPAATKLALVPRAGTQAAMSHSPAHGNAATSAAIVAGPVTPSPHDFGEPTEVRTSTVHKIDADPPTPAAGQMPGSETLASNEPISVAGDVNDASTCLSVESNGRHWGFRNHCAYDVQFAYCLMNASDPLTSCSKGAVSGSVAANSVGALIADQSLKETNADHGFRWFACGGGAGEVVVHLDRSDPPAGHCVRPGAT